MHNISTLIRTNHCLKIIEKECAYTTDSLSIRTIEKLCSKKKNITALQPLNDKGYISMHCADGSVIPYSIFLENKAAALAYDRGAKFVSGVIGFLVGIASTFAIQFLIKLFF